MEYPIFYRDNLHFFFAWPKKKRSPPGFHPGGRAKKKAVFGELLRRPKKLYCVLSIGSLIVGHWLLLPMKNRRKKVAEYGFSFYAQIINIGVLGLSLARYL